MAEYMLRSNGINQVFSAEKQYANNIAELSESLLSIKNGLRINDYSSRAKIEQQLQQIIEALTHQGKQMNSLGTTLEQILNQYTKAEQTITENVTKKSITTQEGSGNTTPQDKGIDISFEKDGINLLKKILPADFAPYITLLASGFTGNEIDGKIVSEFIKSAAAKYKFFGNLADKDAKTALSDLFGLGTYLKDGVPATASERFVKSLKQDLSSYKPDIGSAAKAGKTIAKWGGVVASVVGNGISNYNEYSSGEISGGRAVAETVVETGIDIGKTALISAGVAAAIGGAPVVVVTTFAVGASWLLDKGCEALTGKSVTEFASDLVLDTAEKVADGISDVGGKVCDTLSSVGEGFAKWAFG